MDGGLYCVRVYVCVFMIDHVLVQLFRINMRKDSLCFDNLRVGMFIFIFWNVLPTVGSLVYLFVFTIHII